MEKCEQQSNSINMMWKAALETSNFKTGQKMFKVHEKKNHNGNVYCLELDNKTNIKWMTSVWNIH